MIGTGMGEWRYGGGSPRLSGSSWWLSGCYPIGAPHTGEAMMPNTVLFPSPGFGMVG